MPSEELHNDSTIYRWLDKLGVSAREGIGVVMRQAFHGGNYGLISGITPTTVVISLFLLYLRTTIIFFSNLLLPTLTGKQL